ncbi:sigma-70 family RNA polymerase sigma factor [Aeromicrobium sp. Leaf245]|uniref:sigma-70 family RNA polymerase sigma factor n=1 Tax=Aeromicrobium sp. Leaf245 TaxID=1736306 RepID=UPI0009EA2D83|nr:sigma-70 family RNA polymerase sigma factor [Aeromicrobium sp. Leaf245]
MDLVRRLLQEAPLAPGEERRLALASRSGDLQAREALARGSLRLAAMRVRALGFGPGEIDDAFQVGAMALLAAAARFDPDRGARLATYAWPWITRALQEHRRARLEVPHEVVPEPASAACGPESPAVLDDLAALTTQERDVLLLRYARAPDGTCPTPWADVAQHLGMSVSTARRTGDRAVSRLRQEVGRVCDRAPQVGAIPP